MTAPRPRLYPVAPPDDGTDDRFTVGLIVDVAAVLERYGFPPACGLDHVRLGQGLYRVIYGSAAERDEQAGGEGGP